MSKQNLAIFGTLIAVILAWWVGYSLIGTSEDKPISISDEVTVSPQDTASDDGVEDAAAAEDATGSGISDLGPQYMRFIDWSVDTSEEQARTCFNFSSPIAQSDTEVRDYINVVPSVDWASRITGRTVCLTGLDFAQTYNVTIKSGLTGENEAQLDSDVTIEVSFGDRPAVARFVGDGIILPRIGAQGLAVESVNVDVLEVDVARVPDRMLARRDPNAGESAQAGDYFYVYENAARDIRESIWNGTVKPKKLPNQAVTTVLPITQMIGELEPGAYVVSIAQQVDDDENRPAQSFRWVIVTDLALSSYRADNGLHVSVRSIDSARAVGGVKLTLIASNNRVLGEATTDRYGHASFAAPLLAGIGAQEPVTVLAQGGQGDFAMLDLRRSPLDLSEYDVTGRRAPSPLDPYIFTDRGVYRPGETVNLTAMVRDRRGKAAPRSGTLKLLKPNGVESFSQRFTAEELTAGTYTREMEVPRSAPRGSWTAHITLDGIDQSFTKSFSVEDFIPQKIKVMADAGETPLRLGKTRPLSIKSEFLYGGAGKNLEAEADMRIRIDSSPFEDFKSYSFGDSTESFREDYISIGRGLTDENGELILNVSLDGYQTDTSHPLRAEIVTGVSEPGGRYIQESLRLPIRTRDLYLGIDPSFEGGSARRNTDIYFDVIAVNASGDASDMSGGEWELSRVEWNYNWYRRYGEWRYSRDEIVTPVKTGELDIAAGTPARVDANLTWGRYRLTVREPESGAITSSEFYVGWRSNGDTDRPDMLTLTRSDDMVKPGEKITLSVNSPYAGQGELVIANENVLKVTNISIPEGETELTLDADPKWGGGVYAMVTLYTPRDVKNLPVPRRAVGISYIAVDRSAQTLAMSIEAPEVIRPRGTQSVTLDFDGKRDGPTYVSLAAVDEGILRITKYQSPSPEDWYFGKPQLSLSLYDDYGRLLNPNMGRPAIANSGGDSLGGEGLTAVPTKIISLYSGVVNVKGGKAKLDLTFPDFNGEVRLMAVAWNDTQIGSADKAMKIRDEVPADLYLPRFLAPGDDAIATLSLHNVEGRAGEYTWSVNADGLVDGGSVSNALSLSEGQLERDTLTVSSSALGINDVALNISGPQRYRTENSYQIETRSPYMPTERRVEVKIDPGQTASLPASLFDGLTPSSAQATLSLTRSPRLDAAPYAASLYRYPYGCLEQTISSGLPLLYAERLGGVPGQDKNMLNQKMQAAIYKVGDHLSPNGSYGLWSQGDGYAYSWTGAYATEFLQRAREEGYAVPNSVLATSYRGLKEQSRMPRYSSLRYYDYSYGRDAWSSDYYDAQRAESAAYAHYVLARGGEGDLSGMRYFYDNHASKMRSPQSFAHIGGALAMMGDKSRSSLAFQRAVDALGYDDRTNYYQSSVRDAAVVVAIARETKAEKYVGPALTYLEQNLRDPEDMHTQEKGRVILALAELGANDKDLDSAQSEFAGLSATNNISVVPGQNWQGPSVTNNGDAPFYFVATVYGTPSVAPEPTREGYAVNKALFTPDGQRLTEGQMAKGERAVIVVSFSSTINRSRQTVIADLLPAGFEIETILKPEDGDGDGLADGPYRWIGEISPLQVAEARDDRFVGAIETNRRDDYRVAYVVRAVTAGEFTFPGVVIEDMYRPGDIGRTEGRRISIAAGNEG